MTLSSRWHLNDKGNPGLCSASVNPCPFGGSDHHHDSHEAALAAYEVTMGSSQTSVAAGGTALNPAFAALRNTLRGPFEARLNLGTYSINIHNEKGYGEGYTHIIECDSPYGERQRLLLDAFLLENNLTADIRKSRTSIFARMPEQGV